MSDAIAYGGFVAGFPTDAELTLPDQQAALLRHALQCLNGIAAPGDCVLGGGTALAARWHHRLSVDIDLFTSDANYKRIKPALDHRAEQWKADAAFSEVRIHPTVIHCHLSDGLEFSVAGSDDVTLRPLSKEREAATGVRLQSTGEIIARKIQARMINRESYVVRDAYDVVCCLEFDPQALNEALGALTQGERAALKYDSGSNRLTLDSNQPLIDPIHAEFHDSEHLLKRLFEVLTGAVPNAGRQPSRSGPQGRAP